MVRPWRARRPGGAVGLLGKRRTGRPIAAVLLMTTVLAAPAHARAAEPASAPFGEVRSAAYSVRFAPAIGGTALTMTFGGAGSLLQNGAATGIAAAADLGLLATIFQAGVCGFSFPFDPFPKATLVTNEKGDASERLDLVPAGAAVGIGAQQVTATTDPSV